MNIRLPQEVQKALFLLEQHNFEAYCVGGCVRDSLLALVPHDWDIATSATPVEICSVFQSFRVIETGIQHGTVTVIIGCASLEITTFRHDGMYTDYRKPEAVTFSRELKEDLSRRDFTVNALAYNPKTGIVDLFDGITDLQKQQIKAVGDAKTRFSEDALRILRCLRFAAGLGFGIDPQTHAAALALRSLLHYISAERIRAEFDKLLCGKSAVSVLRENAAVVFEFLPELVPTTACTQQGSHHTIWEETLCTLECAGDDLIIRLALLFQYCGKPLMKTGDKTKAGYADGYTEKSMETATVCLTALKYPTRIKESVLQLIAFHNMPLPVNTIAVKKCLQALGAEQFFRLMQVMRCSIVSEYPALYKEKQQHLQTAEAEATAVLQAEECLTLQELAIGGNDLLRIGFTRNKALGDALNTLLALVVENKLPNDRAALLAFAETLL